MKIGLICLIGPGKLAQEILHAHEVSGEIEEMTRLAGGPGYWLRTIRARHPDVLAIFTERLAWQRGQTALFLLGAMAGARRTIIFDPHGDWRDESRSRTLATGVARLIREATISATTMRRAERELRALEAAIDRGDHKGGASVDRNREPSIIYLRSSPGPGTQAGGAATHINGFISAALDLDANVSIISNDEIAGLDQMKVPIKIVWPQPIGSTRAAFDIYNNLFFTAVATEEVARREPDFIYQRYARFSWVGAAAALRTRRPLFLEYNGSEVWVGRYWDRVNKLDLLARYERLNLQAAARIFVVSKVEQQNLLKAGVESEKIVVNPNGVDTGKFKPGIGRDTARRELGIAPEETLVGFVGTFGPWHGVEVLAKAVTQIPKNIRLRFLLIGSGALRGRVEEILCESGARDRVIMHGTVVHDQVPRLLDACDVLVSPHVPLEAGAEFFGSPTKLFEYMAMGKGIVASRLGQIAEVLVDEETALLVEPGNAEQLADAILRLSGSRDLRERLGNAARRAAVERHTWKQNAQRVIDQYFSLSHWERVGERV